MRAEQAQYLHSLIARDGRPLRTLADLGKRIAQELEIPSGEFSHQALSKWVRGSATPSAAHREVLAAILSVPLVELNQACDGPRKVVALGELFRPFQVIVPNGAGDFRYPNVTIRGSVDLKKAAVYQNWSDLFDPTPGVLVHHFLKSQFKALGWVPDQSGFPLIPYGQTMVPLCTERLALGDHNSLDKHIWFVYLPHDSIDVGVAWRERNTLLLAKAATNTIERFPMARIDLIGYATGKAAFRLEPPQKWPARAS
jgi:transcriptional regulator with XRE-family HTH domain